MSLIETLAFGAVCLLLGAGGTACIKFDRADKAKRKRVADRKARREELRHRAEPDEPETIDPFADEETAEHEIVFIGRQRMAYRPDGVAPAVALRAEQQILRGEAKRLDKFAETITPSADLPTEHFESDAMADFERILADARWGLLNGGELTKALTAQREGMPTGQYPFVASHPDGPGSGDPTIPGETGNHPDNPWDDGGPPKPYVPVVRDTAGAVAAIKAIAKAGA